MDIVPPAALCEGHHSRPRKLLATVLAPGFFLRRQTLTEHIMIIKRAGVFSLISLLGLGGCATMSADECVTSDWHAIGYEDGARGYTADQLGNRRKACAKHGITPDFESYQAGREQGLRQYCQPSRGFSLGAGGSRYNGVCPGDLEADFVDAYNTGHQLHTLRSRVNSATGQINAKNHELDNTHDRIRSAEAKLISAETTIEDRVLLLSDLKELSERTGQLEAEIAELIEERAVYEQQLAAYQAVVGVLHRGLFLLSRYEKKSSGSLLRRSPLWRFSLIGAACSPKPE
jgi:hypothetical protein